MLYANHLTSTVCIIATTTYFMVKNTKSPTKTMLVIFATIPIHELILDGIMGGITNWAGFNEVWASSTFFVPNFRWVFWLSLFLISGVALATTKQRIIMAKITALIAVYVSVWFLYLALSGHSPWTIIGYKPGPMFFDPIDNSIEIFSWLLPMSAWFWIDKNSEWFQYHILIQEMHPHNWLRYQIFYRRRPLPIETTPSAKMNYLKEMKEWESEYLPKGGVEGKTVLDVGAGCGETALFFFNHGAKKVICIEPDPQKQRMILRNAQKLKWDVEIVCRGFRLSDMDRAFDFAKIDCEGCEAALLSLPCLPPLSMEIHGKNLAKSFSILFPQMKVTQKYHWPLRTWLGRVD